MFFITLLKSLIQRGNQQLAPPGALHWVQKHSHWPPVIKLSIKFWFLGGFVSQTGFEHQLLYNLPKHYQKLTCRSLKMKQSVNWKQQKTNFFQRHFELRRRQQPGVLWRWICSYRPSLMLMNCLHAVNFSVTLHWILSNGRFWLLTNLLHILFSLLIRCVRHAVLHVSLFIFPGNPQFHDLFNLSTILRKVIDKWALWKATLIKEQKSKASIAIRPLIGSKAALSFFFFSNSGQHNC